MGSGSKIDVHTVLKLMELAITPRYTSSGASSGRRHLADVERLAGVLVRRLDALPHGLLGPQHVGGPVALGDGEGGDVLAGRAAFDGIEEVLHGAET